MDSISLGFSPCPNDTYIFHALVHRMTDTDIVFKPPYLEDVETLNNWAMKAKLDVTKLSFHALGYVLDEYCVLSSGSALGRGCGPLLIAKEDIDLSAGKQLTIAIPGKFTTASLLFQMFAPQCTSLIEMGFEQIMESVVRGVADAGVIIHESRFTYADQGMRCLQDLGQWWEESSGQPIPLGCIAVKRRLGKKKIDKIDLAIRQSLEMANRDPEKCLPYIREHSQEIDEKVVQDHIGLYVNEFSLKLGDEGMEAIKTFLQRGRRAAILPENSKSITI